MQWNFRMQHVFLNVQMFRAYTRQDVNMKLTLVTKLYTIMCATVVLLDAEIC